MFLQDNLLFDVYCLLALLVGFRLISYFFLLRRAYKDQWFIPFNVGCQDDVALIPFLRLFVTVNGRWNSETSRLESLKWSCSLLFDVIQCFPIYWGPHISRGFSPLIHLFLDLKIKFICSFVTSSLVCLSFRPSVLSFVRLLNIYCIKFLLSVPKTLKPIFFFLKAIISVSRSSPSKHKSKNYDSIHVIAQPPFFFI